MTTAPSDADLHKAILTWMGEHNVAVGPRGIDGLASLLARVRQEQHEATREACAEMIDTHEPVNGTEWTRETAKRVRAIPLEEAPCPKP